MSYRYEVEAQPFGSYKINAQVRRNDVYEQYSVGLDSGLNLSLKSISSALAPSKEQLVALKEPLSVGLLSVLDFGMSEGTGDVIVVTELTGTTLRERLAGKESITPIQAISYLRDLAEALSALERGGLPMPSLTPEAVCLRQDGVRLDDYFLPLLFRGKQLPTNFFLAPYSAPEADGQGPGSKQTLFSLGMVFYEMLTGRPPFEGSTLKVIAAIQTLDVDLARAPEAARSLLARLVARDPAARYASLAELSEELDDRSSLIEPGEWKVPPKPEDPPPGKKGPSLEVLGPNEFGRPEFRRSGDGAVMILVPGGTFSMGNNDGGDAEKPAVQVTVGPFLIDKHPVTWEMFVSLHSRHDRTCDFCRIRNEVLPSRYMGGPRKSRPTGEQSELERKLEALNDAISAQGGEHIPATFLTWQEMRRYADAVGAELPSEAEWEYAARGGTQTIYPWGDKVDPAFAWYDANSKGIPHPVGQKKSNPWGLLDMNGNVLEMCRDQFSKEIYEMVASGAATPEELAEGAKRPSARYSARGGAFTSTEAGVTSSFRIGAAPDIRSELRGFRCVIRKKNAPEWARGAFEGQA